MTSTMLALFALPMITFALSTRAMKALDKIRPRVARALPCSMGYGDL